MKKTLVRFRLLVKRLFKRPSFLFMLLMVPLFVVLLKSQENENGPSLMTVGIYLEDNADFDANYFVENTLRPDSAITFVQYNDKDVMIEDLKRSVIYEAVVVPCDFGDAVDNYINFREVDNPIDIYIRESGVSHNLVRETIQSKFFPILAYRLTEDYAKRNLNVTFTDEELEKLYSENIPEADLFVMAYADGTIADEEYDIVLMPLRGILAVWLVICSLAAAMYYVYDERNGLFTWWNSKSAVLRSLLYHFSVMIPSIIAFLLGLCFSSLMVNPIREIGVALLYSLLLVALANIIRIVLNSIKRIGVIIPLVILLSVALAPVFADVSFGFLNQIIPTYHYLKSTHDGSFVISMFIYTIIAIVSWIVLEKLNRMKKRELR